MAVYVITTHCDSYSRKYWLAASANAWLGGEGFAVDASVIKADANRQRGVPGSEADWSHTSINRPVREYRDALDEADPEPKVPKNLSLTDPGS